MSVNYNKHIKNSFDSVQSEEVQEFIKEVVANFHYRDGKKHEDGSMGSIEISPRQFNDCLAFTMNIISKEV
jgi:hypothetical protein